MDQIAQVKPACRLPEAGPACAGTWRWTDARGETLLAAVGRRGARRALSKADQVHLALKQAITRGEVPPGAAIDKTALCLRFGVSRLPVTTAIHRLAYEGLVLIEPQKGSYVSRIRLDDVLQWMMARRAIEAEVAAEAARRLPAEAAEALARNLRYQEAAVESAGFRRLPRSRRRLPPAC